MAELVHLRLEHGLRELEEMERVKLFSKDEIRKIAKKRKMFEYRLRRRTKKKEDFLQYIEFEICLLLLISKRRERLLVESKKKEIDNSIAKKINRLFKAAVLRYPEDEKLWLNQIEYVKRMKWNDSINALFTKLLQLHSTKPDLWVMAAKWEMEDNHSADNARRIFQRGVLMNRKSQNLWREYFRMELKYIEMIRKRKEVLQLQNMPSPSEENDAVLNGEIVEIVFDKAVEEIMDVEFALSFIKICLEFDFATKHSDYILNSIRETFPDKEETFDALAKQPLCHTKERIQKCTKEGIKKKKVKQMIFEEVISKYDEAVTIFPTEKMWKFYLNYLFESLTFSKRETSQQRVEILILNKMETAAELDCLSMEHYIKWPKMLLKNGDEEKALSVNLSGAKKWNTTSLWYDCLLLHIQCRKSQELIYFLFTEAVTLLEEKDALKIWKLGIDWLTMTDPEKLMVLFEQGITKVKEISLPLKEMYLESTALRYGIESARNLFNKYKDSGHVSPILHQKMIKIEKAQGHPSLTHLRKCYEELVRAHGHKNIDIWLEFMHFESVYAKNPEAYSTLLWRGKKMLRTELIDEFQTRITNLMTEST